MAMVNQIINPLHVKDSRWLTLEVCREFTRQKCTRSDQECKFAHPPPHVEVQNGRVTCCFDSIKGKCQRKDPPCKYLHPPQHLREQLLQNGRNNLILKNLQMQAMAVGLQPMVPGMVPPTMNGGTHLYSPQYPLQNGGSHLYSPSYSIQRLQEAQPRHYSHEMLNMSPYLTSMHNTAPFNPYMGHASMNVSGMIQQVDTGTTVSPGSAQMSVMAGSGVQAAKVSRADRLEVCREFQRGTCARQPSDCRYAHPPDNVTVDLTDNSVTVCMDHVKGKCSRDSCRYFHPPAHLQVQIKAVQQRASVSNAATNAAAAAAAAAGGLTCPATTTVLPPSAAPPHSTLAHRPYPMPGVPLYVPGPVAGHPPSVQRF